MTVFCSQADVLARFPVNKAQFTQNDPVLTFPLALLCFACALHFLEVSVLQKSLHNVPDQNKGAVLHENVPPVGDKNVLQSILWGSPPL